MKVVSYIIIVLALGLIGFNLTKINYSNPFEEGSTIALIGVVAGLCAIVLMLIFRISKSIDERTK
ncbi:hypothetical protein [Flavobacterium sp.]|uniref:hypothetical protein n=1 Tax=Flavobacterium sp. TaxID=239 RepID=UPI0035275D31